MKRIAIVTLYDNINIGNKLQNYAVCKILEDYAGEVETLSYKEKGRALGWKSKLVLLFGFPRSVAKEKRTILRRINRFKVFSQKYLNVKQAESFSAYNTSYSDLYDVFVTGSDQVWHNWTNTKAELDYFFLRFANKEKRICLSPSFGFEEVPNEFKTQYISGLKGFTHLSCREQSGCKIIKELTEIDAVRLIDPTMMLSVEKWRTIEKTPQYSVPKHFILAYCLGGMTEKNRKDLLELSKSMKIPVIDIFNLKYPEYYCTSPDEFLYLVDHCDLVYTNSFHGCVFSILYHKPLRVFDRNDNSGKQMTGRLSTLFDLFQGRINDYDYVDTVLESERIKMKKYLDKCIKQIKQVNDED